ncbi:MoxR family ATPase [Candidatus Woesearchaeota archaeon]|nr:MoxR family ATPase [Candidatus Woesearchaeota archaeon]
MKKEDAMLSSEYEKLRKTFDALYEQLDKIVIGQRETVELILIGLLADSNVLLEGFPGLGKTLMIKTLAQCLDLKFSRIQHTPDLMPSDITGTQVIEEVGGKRFFKFQPGPIFANIVLADEINRATPKTQSALLEAMQEKQVTVASKTMPLDLPFFVLATQNPIEQEGTYPLPEAQADRFLLKVVVRYPTFEEEVKIAEQYAKRQKNDEIKAVIGKNSLLALQQFTRQVPISSDMVQQAVKIVTSTRTDKNLEYGASPRASIGLILAAKARAILNGRNHVSEEDLKTMAYPVLRHRIILNFDAERQGMKPDDAIKELLKRV